MPKRSVLSSVTAAIVAAVASLPVHAASVLPNAVPTITLAASPQGNVAWHPVHQRYYATATGNSAMSAFVFGPTGTLLQTQTLNIDQRTFNYNPNTGRLELVAYWPPGLFSVDLDAAGDLVGTTGTINTTAGAWNLPVYDPARDVFYSRMNDNVVTVRDYAGNALPSITLDLAAAGNPDLTAYTVGYDADEDKLITLDYVGKRALVHDMTGAFVGASQLALTQNTPGSYFMGYTNGQLFVLGQGYDVFGTPVPLPSAALGGAALLAVLAARRPRPVC